MSVRLAPASLTDAAYERLGNQVYEASGIRLGERHRSLVEARVLARLEALGLDGPADYEQRLRSGGARGEEMDLLLDLLAVHESYFFREPAQLELAARSLIPEARRGRPGDPVRVWSAGCASGEEPYSLAIFLGEAERGWRGGQTDLLGTDLSPSCLERARRGAYGPSSLRDTDPVRRGRYFEPLGPEVRLREEVRRRVRFRRVNLYRDGARLALMGRFDLILCRNVLLYFDAEARQRVVGSLYDRLRPGGWLLIGRAETLLNVPSPLRPVEREGEIVYVRQEGGGS